MSELKGFVLAVLVLLAALFVGAQARANACTVTTAAQMQARAADSGGKTCTVSGAIGDVTITARPSQRVIFLASPGASYGVVTFDGSANMMLDGGTAAALVFPSRTGSAHTTNTLVQNMTVGGTAANRSTAWALVSISDGVDNTTIRHSTLHYTLAGDTGNQGYAIRAINGDRDLINGLTVANNHIDHIAGDGMQLAGVANLDAERNEISYIAAEPGSTEHSDSMQILSVAKGTKRPYIARNYIHHVGYFDENATPDDGYPAGQLIVHGWSTVSVLFADNLIRENRNYEPMFKDESNGATADNWAFNYNTIIDSGPPQPTAERAGFWRGDHVSLTSNIFSRYEGDATWQSASGNVVENGTAPGGTNDSALEFDSNWMSIDHPGVGIRQPAGPDW
jgi:hypothetical protein